MKYIAPKKGLEAFTCPHCGVYSKQEYNSVYNLRLNQRNTGYHPGDWLASTVCQHCNKAALWMEQEMLFPNRGQAPLPNPEMPSDVKADYEEAASIAALSPKAAAALLRLAIQKLCVHLGGKGENINNDIASLVKKGLPEKIQQSLDIVRVVGNNAVHPGQIDLDNPDVATNLFQLINMIVETMISMPIKIQNIYSGLPEKALDSIKKRDDKK